MRLIPTIRRADAINRSELRLQLSRWARQAAAGAALILAGIQLAATAQAAPRSPPTRHADEGTVRIDGIEYIDTTDFARRMGLRASWVRSGERLRLANERATVEIEAEKRELSVNGLRVFMGEPALYRRHALLVSAVDADRLLAPILYPGYRQPSWPGLRVIAIDPGHGGKDPGKENGSLRINEKTMTLDVAMRLKPLLEAAGYTVVMTRTSDRFVELGERPEIAARAGADLFISIHFNAVEKDTARVTGTEVYTMTPQFQRSTVDQKRDPTDAYANPGNANDHWNTVLGFAMQRTLLTELGTADRGLKRARWAVLRLATCPAILIESAYLSNEGEARKVATPAFRQAIAVAIAKGIKAYAAQLPNPRR